jgi:hypothetical protein
MSFRVLVSVLLTLGIGGCSYTCSVPGSAHFEASGNGEAEWAIDPLWSEPIEETSAVPSPGHLTVVSHGPDGRSYLIDFTHQIVRIHDRQGRFVGFLGGTGTEFGGFDGPLALAWDPLGRLWVADGWKRRYVVFDTLRTVLKIVPRPLRAASGWAHRMRFEGPREFVEETVWRVGNRLVVGWVRIDTTGAVLDTLPPLPPIHLGEPQAVEGVSTEAIRAARQLSEHRIRLVYDLSPRNTIWFARSDELRLVHLTMDGDTLRIVESEHRRRAMPLLQERRLGQLAGGLIDKARLGSQIVQRIVSLEDGGVLVQMTEEFGSTLDAFDRGGNYVGPVHMDRSLRSSAIPSVRGDTITWVTEDEIGRPYLTRFLLQRSLSW